MLLLQWVILQTLVIPFVSVCGGWMLSQDSPGTFLKVETFVHIFCVILLRLSVSSLCT